MPAIYPDIPDTYTLEASRPLLLDRDEALRKCFAGTAFPTTDPVPAEGMLCFRTDQQILYQYRSAAWKIVGLDYSILSEDAAPSSPNDFVISYDVSAGAFKKVLHQNIRPLEGMMVAASDEITALSAGTNKATFRMPYAFTLTGVKASLAAASSSGLVTVDINESGVSILSTKLTIDASEFTSTTAATAAVISDSALASDAHMSIDIDGAGTNAKGLKVTLLGYRT